MSDGMIATSLEPAENDREKISRCDDGLFTSYAVSVTVAAEEMTNRKLSPSVQLRWFCTSTRCLTDTSRVQSLNRRLRSGSTKGSERTSRLVPRLSTTCAVYCWLMSNAPSRGNCAVPEPRIALPGDEKILWPPRSMSTLTARVS